MTKAQFSRHLLAWIAVYKQPPIVELHKDGTVILKNSSDVNLENAG